MIRATENQENNKTRLYEALGQTVVSFKALELAVEGIIFCGMQVSAAQVRILLASMSFTTKIETLRSIIVELHTTDKFEDFAVTLDEFVERCLFCEQQRNEWLNSYWIPEADSEPGYTKRLRQIKSHEQSLEINIVNLLDLEGFVLCLSATVSYLHAFHQKLFSAFARIRGADALSDYLQIPLSARNDS